MMPPSETALVLFSGGQDSTICLAWALDRFTQVETIGFDYGQRHKVELECRDRLRAAITVRFPRWRNKLGIDHCLDLSVISGIGDTALTSESALQISKDGLPNTFVPGRNLLMFTVAAALAYRRGTRHMIGGMCETDYSGYPDCRDDSIKALQVALGLGMDRRFIVHTPLMWLDKAATWRLAAKLGGVELVELIRRESHSCYLGNREKLHAWGYGCGTCPACQLRARGWAAYCADLSSPIAGQADDEGGGGVAC